LPNSPFYGGFEASESYFDPIRIEPALGYFLS
jgi:hypothetical protein